MDYQAFLNSKSQQAGDDGFKPVWMSDFLYDFQKDLVEWSLRKGRSAIFADCGLGKTPMQLVWADNVVRHTGKPVLILTPLAVGAQTVREGEKFHIDCHQSRDGTWPEDKHIIISNYERLHYFKPSDFAGIVLDESSILKAFGGVTRKEVTAFGQQLPYRLCCTATPAPNDLIELTNHAEFLDVLTGKEIIALFFKQDGNTTHSWRLKGHAKEAFWKWLASWSSAVKQPSDLGYDNEAFDLPPLNMHDITVGGKTLPGMLFPVEAHTLQERQQARKQSVVERVAKAASLVNESTEPWIVWCNLNYESEALRKAIPDAIEIRGSDSAEHKEQGLAAFSAGDVRVLVTKPSIAGWGMNWQHCANVAFVGLSDSYEQFYQAIRRCWRFGQEREVNAYVIAADTEGAVVANIRRKERQARNMFNNVVRHMKLSGMCGKWETNIMEYREEGQEGKGWSLMLGDSCERLEELETDSVGLNVFSPPFPGMYAYTNSPRDMGNCQSVPEMLEHFYFLMPELLRVTMPGRMCCVHLMQLTAMQSRDGYIGVKDYRGAVIHEMQEAGWIYAGEVTIDKNPQVQAVRNKERGLLFKTLATDSSRMRMALADYVIYFRKPGNNPTPIHAGMSEKYNNGHGWITEEEWIEWASPVWYRRVDKDGRRTIQNYPGRDQATDGIMETDVLNNFRDARAEDDERHLCPLQLGVIERCIKLWSAPGDLVLSPFAGIGSEGYKALLLGRKFVGIELKDSYYHKALENLRAAADKHAEQLLPGMT